MTEEMTEDKNEEELSRANPLFAEVSDAIDNIVQTAAPQELEQFAVALAACATRVAIWAGYILGMNHAKQLAKDVIAGTE